MPQENWSKRKPTPTKAAAKAPKPRTRYVIRLLHTRGHGSLREAGWNAAGARRAVSHQQLLQMGSWSSGIPASRSASFALSRSQE